MCRNFCEIDLLKKNPYSNTQNIEEGFTCLICVSRNATFEEIVLIFLRLLFSNKIYLQMRVALQLIATCISDGVLPIETDRLVNYICNRSGEIYRQFEHFIASC